MIRRKRRAKGLTSAGSRVECAQQLGKTGYDRALSVHMMPLEGFDHRAEMRKMRLLLESLL